jgi:hypothetical protein
MPFFWEEEKVMGSRNLARPQRSSWPIFSLMHFIASLLHHQWLDQSPENYLNINLSGVSRLGCGGRLLAGRLALWIYVYQNNLK